MRKNNALKICATVSMMLVPFPLIFLFDGVAFENISYTRYLIYAGLAFIPMLAGYFLRRLKSAQIKLKKVFLVNMLIMTTVIAQSILCAVIVNSINAATGFLFTAHNVCFGLIPSMFIWFYLGMKLHRTSFSDIFTFAWLGAFVAETFICYIFSCVIEKDYEHLAIAKSNIVILLVIVALLTVLLINQTNIETQINQRKNTNLIVPKGLRSYNAVLIMIVGIFILSGLLLKDIIAAFLVWFITTLFRIIDAILFAIKAENTGGAQVAPETTVPDGFFTAESGRDYTLFFALIVVIVLVIVFRKQIIAAFKAIAQRVFGKFSVPETVSDDTLGYTDTYEAIELKTEKIIRETEKDCLKSYRKETDPTKKFRVGYKLYLMWLKNHSKCNIEKLTVEQQKNLSNSVYHGETDISDISDSYSEIRYGDKNADNKSATELDSLINELY